MNRVDYLYQLDQSLKSLPEQERREAVEFYYSYFEDGHENGKTDEEIIEELGPVSKVAAKIIAQANFEAKSAASREAIHNAQSSHSIFSGISGVFLAIGAVIIGLPGAVIIGIPVLGVLFGLFIAALAILFALGILIVVVPISLLIAAFGCFVTIPVIGVSAFGFGIMAVGLALLAGTLLYLGLYWGIKGIALLAGRIMNSFASRRGRKAEAK